MSQPMPIVAGSTYMLTRRCAGRHRWLTPGGKLNRLFLYLFAVGAVRFGLEVHALVVMSTHYHAVLTDPLGTVPAFEQWLHSLLARSVNHLRGRTDTFWDGRHGGRQRIMDAEALRRALVYVWNNPTEAGLVRRGKEWPGVRTRPHDMLAALGAHRPMTIRRPDDFFASGGSMPGVARLTLSVPAMLLEDEMGRGERADTPPGGDGQAAPAPNASVETAARRLIRALTELVQQAEDGAAEALMAAGRTFVGARSVLRQRSDKTSTEPERHGAKLTRVPLFLVSSREARAELLEKLHKWRGLYRSARLALAGYLAGGSSTDESAPDLGLFEDQEKPAIPIFPWGTYQLRLRLSVPCHPPPRSA